MAARKQFLNVGTADPELLKLLEETRDETVSEEELKEQRISFAFGNAPANSTLITKESVRASSLAIKLRTDTRL